MSEQVNVAAAPAIGARTAVWEDFIDIIYAPAAVFVRRQQGSFWIPMLTVTMLVGALFFLNSGALQPIMDAEFSRAMAAQMRRNPAISMEAAEQFKPLAARMAQVFIFLGTPMTIALTGAALWLIGKLFDAKQTFHAALVVASYAFVPRVLQSVVDGVQALMMDPDRLNGRFRTSLGVGRFFDPDTTSAVLLAAVGRIDVFTIWVTILLAIGLSETGKIPRGRAYAAAVLVWAIGAIPLIVQSARAM